MDATPWWAVAAAMAAGASLAASLLAIRQVRVLMRNIARARQREASWKLRFDDIFERSPDVVVAHEPSGRIATLNRAGERVTGYGRDELRIIDPEWVFSVEYLEGIRRVIEDGADGAPRTFRAAILPRRGGRVAIEVEARVVSDEGEVIGVTAIGRDLSDHQRLESELRQAQKMEAVGRLATGIAHDFNNLITVLLGHSDRLLSRVPVDAAYREPAEQIRFAAERASGLTQQLLAFSRRQSTSPQTIDINLTITNMEALLRRLLGADVHLVLALEPGLWHVLADPGQIGQVIMNLVINARDAMPRGGTVYIETGNVTLDADRPDVVAGPHVMLLVRDTGSGMSDDARAQLTDATRVATEVGQGTGLGLSLVQAIVRQHAGHVSITSESGKGTTLRVHFPRAAALPVPAMPMALSTPTVHGSGVVLLAGDHAGVRALMATELSRRGFNVLEAADGHAALELAGRHDGVINVLVTDSAMPDMTGVELASALEQLRPDLRTVYVAGAGDRDATHASITPMPDVLLKPFTADELAARITATMEEARG
ncbi:MAG: response regulator [Acidobacteria bacterium]|nr:response regulator [Acidobacteriota bacterium]